MLAAFADGNPAVVVRKGASGASIFLATTEVPPALYRHAARVAGAHLYAESDANIYANGPFVAVHASGNGPLVDVGAQGPVTDEISRQALGMGPKVALDIKTDQTRVLRLGARGSAYFFSSEVDEGCLWCSASSSLRSSSSSSFSATWASWIVMWSTCSTKATSSALT